MTVDAGVKEEPAGVSLLRQCVWGFLLLVLVLVSAITVIYASHKNRQLFSGYQEQLNLRDDMEVEWGQLLLEQSALAAHARVEQVAMKKLGMRVPETNEIVVVRW